jgi:predicted small lipoprotein YifL
MSGVSGSGSRRVILRGMRTERLLVVACLAGILLGCGQKGPLVLPDAQHPHKKVGIGKPPASSAPKPAPASPAPPTAAPTDATAADDVKAAPPTPQP